MIKSNQIKQVLLGSGEGDASPGSSGF